MLVVAPGEVGVGLGEAYLCQQPHHLWLGEGFGQEDDFGVLPMDFADHPFPERHGFGMRIVDAEGGHPLVYPEQEDPEHFLPQAVAVSRAKVERIDVLVFLGRVLGVFDRSVGAMEEPVRMRGHVGMVG
jgi:hypothetical protein